MDAVVDHRTPEQRRDDDFEAIRRGLNEAIAHAKGDAEARERASMLTFVGDYLHRGARAEPGKSDARLGAVQFDCS